MACGASEVTDSKVEDSTKLLMWRVGRAAGQSQVRSSACRAPLLLVGSSSSISFQSRCQSQARQGFGKGQYGPEGIIDPRYSASQNWKKFNADTAAHYVKATIQNDRREMGLSPVVDWKDFGEEAIAIPTKRGELWIGADDPRCAKFIKRREKMKQNVGQIPRKQPSVDPAKAVQDHPFRQFFVSPITLTDPMSVSDGLYRAGMVKEYDVKFTAGKINYVSRPPVVSIMGHVDHGKTTLLDYLRKTNVAAGEAGGITQTVGAFTVNTPDGSRVTFIDTPGHAAFSNMREVGALITDMIVLIVSTIDGVQPQTIEVIKLAQQNLLPMVVACSKIDRNPDMSKIKDELRKHNVELEEDGGDVQLVGISSIDGTGIPNLLEAISLQAALSEVSTPTPSRCEVSVLESKDVGDRNEVYGIVRCGELKPGMTLVSGLAYATVKEVFDETLKKQLTVATPGTPVMLHGFKALPKPGNILMQVSSLAHAEKFYHFMKDVYLVEGKREDFLRTQNAEAAGSIYTRKPDHNNMVVTDDHTVNLVMKADSFGGLQALLRQVYELPKIKGVRTCTKTTEVGPMRAYDTMFASQGSGHPSVILLFGKCADRSFGDPHSNTKVIQFDVLYHGIQMLKEALVGFLPPIKKERVTALAECQQVFKASQAGRNGNAGGFVVKSGALDASHVTFRVMRKPSKDAEPECVYDGQIKELRRFKELVATVEQGMECGVIMYDEFQFKAGDVLEQVEAYEEPRDVEAVFEEAYRTEEIMRQKAMFEDQAAAALPSADDQKQQQTKAA